jgi:heptaprenylglyceryl phosphate synthase
MGQVFNSLLDARAVRGGGFLLLIDPDRSHKDDYLALAEAASECRVDAILVGTSFMMAGHFPTAVREIKARANLPVIIFPGSFTQITSDADAILYTSLISGRNPQYLIDEQVKGAPFIKAAGLEAIPTGYMLIESGPLTSVQFISGTLPIPRSKPDIAGGRDDRHPGAGGRRIALTRRLRRAGRRGSVVYRHGHTPRIERRYRVPS